MNVDLNEFQTNLLPCSRLHFMKTKMAPVSTKEKAEAGKSGVQSISETCFQPATFLVKVSILLTCLSCLFSFLIGDCKSLQVTICVYCLFYVYFRLNDFDPED